MNICQITTKLPAFTASSEDNTYKTNAGKYLGLGVGAGYVAHDIYSKKGMNKFFDHHFDKFANAVKEEWKAHNPASTGAVNGLKTDELKNTARLSVFASTIGVLVGCLAIGALFDYCVNYFNDRSSRNT